ncbi:MAG: hypothetical protein M3O30_03635 [Planctomycetota bacterium]|nr:hypothetical protein [Planctomycetota bacterium]
MGLRQLNLRPILAGLLLLLGAGCATIRVTDPPRSATEQFLESDATRHAVQNIAADQLRDRKVFLDASYVYGLHDPTVRDFDLTKSSPEDLFLVAELRSKLLFSGVRLVEKREDAEIVLEVRTGGIGVDRTEFLLGLPGLVLTTNTVANVPISTPELAIIKSTKQHGFASVAYVAYWRDTGEIVASSGPFVGRTYRDDYWYFGIGPRTVGDIPPAQKPVPTAPTAAPSRTAAPPSTPAPGQPPNK